MLLLHVLFDLFQEERGQPRDEIHAPPLLHAITADGLASTGEQLGGRGRQFRLQFVKSVERGAFEAPGLCWDPHVLCYLSFSPGYRVFAYGQW